jgi:putative endonuclease
MRRRFIEHRNGRAAQYTKKNHRTPLELVYVETAEDRGAAMRRESQIKRWSHTRKRETAEEGPDSDYLMQKYEIPL